MMKRCSRPKMA